jgi:hypothetical protein
MAPWSELSMRETGRYALPLRSRSPHLSIQFSIKLGEVFQDINIESCEKLPHGKGAMPADSEIRDGQATVRFERIYVAGSSVGLHEDAVVVLQVLETMLQSAPMPGWRNWQTPGT